MITLVASGTVDADTELRAAQRKQRALRYAFEMFCNEVAAFDLALDDGEALLTDEMMLRLAAVCTSFYEARDAMRESSATVLPADRTPVDGATAGSSTRPLSPAVATQGGSGE